MVMGRNKTWLILCITTLLWIQPGGVQSSSEEDEPDGSSLETIWTLSRRSLQVDSGELKKPIDSASTELENEGNAQFSRPSILSSSRRQLDRFRYVSPDSSGENEGNVNVNVNGPMRLWRRSSQEELEDYDFDQLADAREEEDEDEEEEEEERMFRSGKKGKKKKKKKKKKGGDDDSEEIKKLKERQKYVPQFWLGKEGGAAGLGPTQIGYIINNDANDQSGWKVWPQTWSKQPGVDVGDLKYIDGKGWTGKVGAPWRQENHQWGPGFGHIKHDDEGKGKKKKKKGGKGKKKKGKGKKKKKKKKKKGPVVPCEDYLEDDISGMFRMGRGKKDKKDKGKKGKKGGGSKKGWGGWVADPCQKMAKPWFGWPQKIKFVPPPPRGSQVWLKGGWSPPKSGWSDHHGWNWKKKITSGWGVSDLIGVVHLRK